MASPLFNPIYGLFQLTKTRSKVSSLSLTVIVVIVSFAMLVFYGLAVVMYDELVTASGSQAAEAYNASSCMSVIQRYAAVKTPRTDSTLSMSRR